MKLNVHFSDKSASIIKTIKTLNNIDDFIGYFGAIQINKNLKHTIQELSVIFYDSLGMDEFDSVMFFLAECKKTKISIIKLNVGFNGFTFLITDLVRLSYISDHLKIDGALFSRNTIENYLVSLKHNDYGFFSFSILFGNLYEKKFDVTLMTNLPNYESVVIFADKDSDEVHYENDFFEKYGFLFV